MTFGPKKDNANKDEDESNQNKMAYAQPNNLMDQR